MLKRSKRIHGRTLVQKILKEGTAYSGPFVKAITYPNELGFMRYAVIVGKKLAPSAVTRNQKRRQIYEILRIMEKTQIKKEDSLNKESLDIVLMVRTASLKARFEELENGILNTLRLCS